MYKKTVMFSSLLVVLLFSGCTRDTTPSGSILNKIEENKIMGEKNIALIIKDYYSKGLKNIKSPVCSKLSSNSDDLIELSIIETSKKYCGKISEFKQEIKKTISEINSKKGMAITFDMVNGREEFLKANFPEKAIDIFLKYNIDINEAKKIIEISEDLEELENVYFKHGIQTAKLIDLWKSQYLKNKYIIIYLEAGFPIDKPEHIRVFANNNLTPERFKKWKKMGYSVSDIILLGQNFVPVSDDKFINFLTNSKLTRDEVIEFSQNRINTLQSFQSIVKKNISLEEYKKYKKLGVYSTDAIVYFRKNKISSKEIQKYYKISTNQIVPLKIIKELKNANVKKEYIVEITKILGEYHIEKYKKYKEILNVNDEQFIDLYKDKYLRTIDIRHLKELKNVLQDNKRVVYYSTLLTKSEYINYIDKFFKNDEEFQRFYENNFSNLGYRSFLKILKISNNKKELNEILVLTKKYDFNNIARLKEELSLNVSQIEKLLKNNNIHRGHEVLDMLKNITNGTQKHKVLLLKEALDNNIVKLKNISAYIKSKIK